MGVQELGQPEQLVDRPGQAVHFGRHHARHRAAGHEVHQEPHAGPVQVLRGRPRVADDQRLPLPVLPQPLPALVLLVLEGLSLHLLLGGDAGVYDP